MYLKAFYFLSFCELEKGEREMNLFFIRVIATLLHEAAFKERITIQKKKEL